MSGLGRALSFVSRQLDDLLGRQQQQQQQRQRQPMAGGMARTAARAGRRATARPRGRARGEEEEEEEEQEKEEEQEQEQEQEEMRERSAPRRSGRRRARGAEIRRENHDEDDKDDEVKKDEDNRHEDKHDEKEEEEEEEKEHVDVDVEAPRESRKSQKRTRSRGAGEIEEEEEDDGPKDRRGRSEKSRRKAGDARIARASKSTRAREMAGDEKNDDEDEEEEDDGARSEDRSRKRRARPKASAKSGSEGESPGDETWSPREDDDDLYSESDVSRLSSDASSASGSSKASASAAAAAPLAHAGKPRSRRAAGRGRRSDARERSSDRSRGRARDLSRDRSRKRPRPARSTRGELAAASSQAPIMSGASHRPTRHAAIAVDYVDAEEPLSVVLPSSNVKPDLKRILQRLDRDSEAARKPNDNALPAGRSTPAKATPGPSAKAATPPSGQEEDEEASGADQLEASEDSTRYAGFDASAKRGLMQRAAHLDLEYDADSDDEDFVAKLGAGITLDEFETMVEIAEQEEFMASMFAWTQDELDERRRLESDLATLRGDTAEVEGDESRVTPAPSGGSESAGAAGDQALLTSVERLRARFHMCASRRSPSQQGLDERVGALFPFNCAGRLSARCCADATVAEFFEFWVKKRRARGPLLRRFQKSDLLVNWSTTEVYADEDDLSGPDAVTRRGALSMLYTLRAMHDDFVQVEALTGRLLRREELKLQLIIKQ